MIAKMPLNGVGLVRHRSGCGCFACIAGVDVVELVEAAREVLRLWDQGDIEVNHVFALGGPCCAHEVMERLRVVSNVQVDTGTPRRVN